MNAYEILAITGAYLGLLITVIKMITANNKSTNQRLEDGSIKMAIMSKDIKTLEKEVSCKANRELVENQLHNIEEKLDEIKKLIEKGK